MMKKLIIIFYIFLTVSCIELLLSDGESNFVMPSASGATYYVAATGGSNSYDGSIGSPWATLQYAFSQLTAGDILYVRGGTYSPSTTYGNNRDNCVYVSGRNGTSSSRITVSNYPGETPVITGANLPESNSNKSGIHLYNCDYWTITGLVVEYIEDTGGTTNFGIGWYIASSDYITLDQCVSRYNDGPGFAVNGYCNEGYFIRCDSYWNADNHDSGGFGDGFIASHYGGDGGYHTYFQYCRAWNNSDDGFDAFISDSGNNGGYITWEHCWAFNNGKATPSGNGAGIKWGGGSQGLTESGVQRIVRYCISASNKAIGIDQSGSNDPSNAYFIGVLHNNFSYANGSQGFYNDISDASYFRNNISYGNTGSNWVDQTGFTDDHNSWNGGVTVSSADFTGLDIDELDDARASDGSLPDITSFKLVEGSDLIDAGTATVYSGMTITYEGDAPDLGAFEYGGGSPVYVKTSSGSWVMYNGKRVKITW